MLFNSYEFILLFLPITLIIFFVIGKRGHHRIAISWIVGASLFFYGWWNPAYLGLIIFSILFNYSLGIFFASGPNKRLKKLILILGIATNLIMLGYFKYANFFVDNLNYFVGTNYKIEDILLPLAISFFTFQQITYLVDSFRGEAREYNFLHYCLFVTFFPQLIAGPIVHHNEMLPQFARDRLYQLNHKHLAVGISIFCIGLFKKVVLADNISVYATPVFNFADSGLQVGFFDAWVGTLAYTFQLYFDFSGYSDMAIGAARMFGIRLPLNFNSPYRSFSIIEFWRRWHITLSRFLRDYLYIPLGGNRKGPVRRQANLIITMLLGGLWHGAGWNFILWGGMHGIYLTINHAWRVLMPRASNPIFRTFAWSLTFFAVVFAWVPFRATTIDGTLNIWKGMLGLQGISLGRRLQPLLDSYETKLHEAGVVFDGFFRVESLEVNSFAWIFLLFLVAVFFPNTQQVMRRYRPAHETYKGEINRAYWPFLEWRPSIVTMLIVLLMMLYSLTSMSEISEFLYFNF